VLLGTVFALAVGNTAGYLGGDVTPVDGSPQVSIAAIDGDLVALSLLALLATLVGPALARVQAKRRHRLAVRGEAHVWGLPTKPRSSK